MGLKSGQGWIGGSDVESDEAMTYFNQGLVYQNPKRAKDGRPEVNVRSYIVGSYLSQPTNCTLNLLYTSRPRLCTLIDNHFPALFPFYSRYSKNHNAGVVTDVFASKGSVRR